MFSLRSFSELELSSIDQRIVTLYVNGVQGLAVRCFR